MLQRRTTLSRTIAGLSALTVGLVLALLALSEPLPVRAARDIVFDSFQRLAPRPFAGDMPARIVDIDDESLERIGQWPWPRSTMARLVEAVGAHGPAVIALDLVFSEPDRTSPERVLSLLPASPEREALERRLTTDAYSNDKVLAAAMTPLRVISGVVLSDAPRPVPVIAGFATAGDDPRMFLPKFAGAVGPIAVLHPALKGFGALNWVPEYDLVVRRVPAVLIGGDKLVPSLAIEALRVAQGASTLIIKASNASGETGFGQQTGVVSVKVGALVIPTDADGAVRLRYAGTRPERRIPAWKVLEGEVPRAEIDGRLIFVGSSAAALADLRASPLDPVIPGVEVHAEMVEHALAGARLARPDWAPGAEAVATLMVALMAAVTAATLAPLLAAGAGVALMAGVGYGSWRLFLDWDLLLNPLGPAAAAGLAFAIATVLRWKASDAERRAVRNAFAHYLAPAMVEQLAQSPERLALGGEQRVMTLLFSDVRGFTGLAETFRDDPQRLTALMNRLLTPLTNAILERSGTIDKYMGDAVMAFWNAPLDVPDHAGLACAAALDMRTRLANLNAELAREAASTGRPHHAIDIGIGLNSGPCVVGNMGSDLRFDYSVLGDAVNLASRLEGQTRAYGVNILAGEATVAAVGSRFAMLELDSIRVKGKQQPERIFAILGAAETAATPEFAALVAATSALLSAYRAADWTGAARHLAQLAPLADAYGIGGYCAMMAARISRYQAAPPPANWDGVFSADQK
jgi:adenylate cyclase